MQTRILAFGHFLYAFCALKVMSILPQGQPRAILTRARLQ
jgi:hypothetical protein